MGLKFGLLGIVLTGLAATTASAQDDWHEPPPYPESWDHEPHETPEPEQPYFEVKCRAQNDFGYVASAHGRLHFGSRTPFNSVTVNGTLELDAHFIDDPSAPREVTLQGTIDLLGQYLFADVTWGADDLQSVFFAFGDNSMSYVQSKTGTQYQSECSMSKVKVPTVADLTPTKKLRFEPIPEALLRAQLEVLNVGNAVVKGPAARIRIAGQDVKGTLYDSTRSKNELSPGEQGYIEVYLAVDTLKRCGSYAVILDLDHKLQYGAFDPFANDSAEATTPCLRWNTPITEEALGVPADPLIAYQTLDSIVNSQVVARADGRRCNQCHYSGSGMGYSPAAGTITPTLQIGSHAWTGYDGWAYEFYNQPDTTKPAYLKQAFRRWLDDGGQ